MKLAELIPWEAFEEEYASQFKQGMGAPAKSFRMALGALIIKERLGSSDRGTVEQIRENPILQYFLGLSEYSTPMLQLRNTELLPLRQMSPPKPHQQHKQIAPINPRLRKLCRLTSISCPAFHRIDAKSSIEQRFDNPIAVCFKILKH